MLLHIIWLRFLSSLTNFGYTHMSMWLKVYWYKTQNRFQKYHFFWNFENSRKVKNFKQPIKFNTRHKLFINISSTLLFKTVIFYTFLISEWLDHVWKTWRKKIFLIKNLNFQVEVIRFFFKQKKVDFLRMYGLFLVIWTRW